MAEVEESHTVTLPTEHSYVRIYGAMCAVIREDGDMLSDGYSVFQRNLQYLKEEIRENLLLCKSKMHGFTGLDVLSVLPVCFLPAGHRRSPEGSVPESMYEPVNTSSP